MSLYISTITLAEIRYGLRIMPQDQRKDNLSDRFSLFVAKAFEQRILSFNAISVLKKASKHWPNQYDILMTLILYLEKTDDKNAIYKYLTALSALAPNAPDVKKRVKKYSR